MASKSKNKFISLSKARLTNIQKEASLYEQKSNLLKFWKNA